jgi:hypothetical protein
MTAAIRLPWQPLERHITRMFGRPRHGGPDCTCTDRHGPPGECWTNSEAATLCGVSARRISHWVNDTGPYAGLTVIRADETAIRLGVTPDQIWSTWETVSLEWAENGIANRNGRRKAAA